MKLHAQTGSRLLLYGCALGHCLLTLFTGLAGLLGRTSGALLGSDGFLLRQTGPALRLGQTLFKGIETCFKGGTLLRSSLSTEAQIRVMAQAR